jgi:hypothetical protein
LGARQSRFSLRDASGAEAQAGAPGRRISNSGRTQRPAFIEQDALERYMSLFYMKILYALGGAARRSTGVNFAAFNCDFCLSAVFYR